MIIAMLCHRLNRLPGGGTAVAIALSQGAALAVMVCNLTLKSDKWEGGWGAANQCLTVASPLGTWT